MAGSLQKFIYFDDEGNGKLVNLDESNMRAMGDSPATPLSIGAISRKVFKLSGDERYVLCTANTAGGKTVTRKVTVLTRGNPLFQNGGSIQLPVLVDANNGTVENLQFQITRAVGESKTFALLGQDTGLDDGSQP